MINVLNFSMTHEYKHAWNTSARACFFLFTQLKKCMILYKYELASGLEVPFIWTKFGTGNPDKIVYEKLIGDSIILFHLDVFQRDPEKLRYLIDWCLNNNINLYIPFENFSINKVRLNKDNEHLLMISNILDEYQLRKYDMTNIVYNNESEIESKIKEKLMPLLRDIKLKNLFS